MIYAQGPFTWEQMRHWYEAGYFNTDKLLVKNAEELGAHYIPLKSAFPKEEEAFLPRGDVAAIVKGMSSSTSRVCALMRNRVRPRVPRFRAR